MEINNLTQDEIISIIKLLLDSKYVSGAYRVSYTATRQIMLELQCYHEHQMYHFLHNIIHKYIDIFSLYGFSAYGSSIRYNNKSIFFTL